MTHPRTGRSPTFKSRPFRRAKPRWHTRISQTSIWRSIHFDFFFPLEQNQSLKRPVEDWMLTVTGQINVEVLSRARVPLLLWIVEHTHILFAAARAHNTKNKKNNNQMACSMLRKFSTVTGK